MDGSAGVILFKGLEFTTIKGPFVGVPIIGIRMNWCPLLVKNNIWQLKSRITRNE